MSTIGWKLAASPQGVNLESRTIATGDPADLFLTGDHITLNSASGTIINGNLTVNGTTTMVDSENVSVKDPLIALARDNESNTLDIGFYGQYTSSGTKYTGMFFDASDSKFKLFKELTPEPTTTVDTSHPSFTKASLVANVEGTVSSIANFTTDDLLEGNSNFYYADSKARSAISVAGNAIAYNSTSGEITVNLANTALPMFSAYKQHYTSSSSSTDLVRFTTEDVTIDTIDGWSLVTHLFTTNQDGKFRISFSFTPGEFSPDISLILYRNGTETTRKVSNYVSGGNVRGTVAMDIIEELTTGTSLGVRITIDRISYPSLEVTLENVSFVVQMLPENYFFPTSGVSESPVVSVNGQSGVVLLNTSNIPEGSQPYFTAERARAAISAGEGIIYDENTGVITSDAALQWKKSGDDDIYYNDGNVGIGTSEPVGKLHVVGDIIQNDVAIGHGPETVLDNSSGTSIDTARQFNFLEGEMNGTGGRGIWATKIDGSGNERGQSVATDTSGNVYTVGFYSSSPVTIFNSDGTSSGLTLTNAGSNGVFIVKYNSSGIAQWATRIDGTGDDRANGIATDSAGNVYVTGSYTGTPVVYSVGDVSFATLSNSGNSDAFVVKYNSSGVAQWVTRIDGTGAEIGLALAVDLSGNVHVTGTYSSTTLTIRHSDGEVFGTLLRRSADINAAVESFIVKYNTSGSVQWATNLVGTRQVYASGIAVGPSGEVVVSGTYNRSLTVINANGTESSIGFFEVPSTSSGHYFYFTVKYDEFGVAVWGTTLTGFFALFSSQPPSPLNIYNSMVVVDSTGSVIVSTIARGLVNYIIYNSDLSIFTASTVDRSAGSSGLLSPTSADKTIVVKYNPDGFGQWSLSAKNFNGNSGGLAVDSFDNIYFSIDTSWSSIPIISANGYLFGDLHELVILGSGHVTGVVKCDYEGRVRWVSGISIDSLLTEAAVSVGTGVIGSGLAIGSDGNVYVSGLSTRNVTISNSDRTAFGDLSFEGHGAFLVKFTGEGNVFKSYDLLPLTNDPENQGRVIHLVNKNKTPSEVVIRDSSNDVVDIRQIRDPLKYVFFDGSWYPY